MLSLIFLPILFIAMIPTKKSETVLRFSLTSDRPATSGITAYNTSFVLEKTKGKHLITIDLDGNIALNGRKMLYIEQEAMRINYSYDTTSVIRVSLSDSTTYGTFVQLLNIMTADVIKRYALIGNDFYIFGEPPVTAIPFTADCFLCNDVVLMQKQYTSYEKFCMKAKRCLAVFSNNKLFCTAFAFLILIPSVFSIYSKNRKA